MPTSIPDQLLGVARVLREAVAPGLADPYAADVLRGVVSTIETLATGARTLAPFLAWDIEETATLLRSIDVEPPAAPSDPHDPDQLEQWHRATRAALEAAIPTIRQDPAATAATVAHLRARAGRYPLVTQYRREPDAQPSR